MDSEMHNYLHRFIWNESDPTRKKRVKQFEKNFRLCIKFQKKRQETIRLRERVLKCRPYSIGNHSGDIFSHKMAEFQKRCIF